MASASRTLSALTILSVLAMAVSCGPESRTEGRQRRLDAFRSVLPGEVRAAFDSIDSEDDCEHVGLLLSAARAADPELDTAVDSIMKAELIDLFSDRDIVYFFWFYFAHAIGTGSVPEP